MRIQFIVFFVMAVFFYGCRNTPQFSTIDYMSIQNTDSLDKNYELSIEKQITSQKDILLFYPSSKYLDHVVWSKIHPISLQKEVVKSLKVIYDSRGYEPIWIVEDRSKSLYPLFVEQIQLAESHGIEKDLYQFADIAARIEKLENDLLSIEEIKQLELDISKNYLVFTHHLMYGVNRPVVPEEEGVWLVQDRRFIRVLDLANFRSKKDVKEYYNAIKPKAFQYELMQDNLAVYENLTNEKWSQIFLSDEDLLEKGDISAKIPAVKKRLNLLGKLYADSSYMNHELFDDRLKEVIATLQAQFGLKSDGVIGASTLEALNTTPAEIVDKIKLNLERMRWLQVNENQQYLQVNIPSYELKGRTKSGDQVHMRAIVGKEKATTPVFSDTLKYVVFSPTWTVPKSIKGKEMLPKLQKDSSHYSEKSFKFYSGWSTDEKDEIDPKTIDWSQYDKEDFPFNAVQQPGDRNALGSVKFIMPNDMSIYLHDTPIESKFSLDDRAFSHGCIRLEEPAELAYNLLKDQSKRWTRSDIVEAMDQEKPQKVYLESPCPVIITYFTAYIDEFGALNLRDDVYDFDEVQLEKLPTKLL